MQSRYRQNLSFSDGAEADINSLVRGQSILLGILAPVSKKPVQMVSRWCPDLVIFGPDFLVQTIWTNFGNNPLVSSNSDWQMHYHLCKLLPMTNCHALAFVYR
jgi:hypothetical protein